ncbi:interleukin 12 receptor, beta 2a, like [Eucyclogobius newberryi]|uniref:interleukin 12 receptor, beta 2a, like n=1 Tax=Eucyclogobius newberryi TaxID=166745 RepID=UPI003B5CA03D
MATVTSVWFLSSMMAACTFSIKGSPVNPSPPECHIPCDDNCFSANIICTWKSKPDPNNSLTYTLHWEGYKSNATSHMAIIHRRDFNSHDQLQVWVQAQDQDGTVFKSENVSFNTADIIKPTPPKIVETCQNPIEIHWSSPCEQLMLELGHCEVRHRKEADTAWIQPEQGGVSGSYTLNNPEPNTNYSFQVRCACGTSMMMSNWTDFPVILSAERAPIGKLDIWRDCDEMLLQKSDCVLTWKKLTMFEARGHILGYNWKLHYNNGTIWSLKESAAASVFLICREVQCYLNSSLKDVKSVSINAYNALGMTAPSHLALETPATIADLKAIDLEMKENKLTVSWNVTWITDNINEFVVQYKEAGSPLGEGLDWVRVNRSLTKITIKGKFKKYTAYQVSVSAVMDRTVQWYCTDVTHFVQGIPAKVPLFKVLSYGSTHVTLLWETVLMSVQNNVTPYYQVGYGKDQVYNVSAYPQIGNRTLMLKNLAEDHYYEVWIKAVTQTGPGPNTTVLFKTMASENIGRFLPWFMGIILSLLLILGFFCCPYVFRKRETCPIVFSSLYGKVPDPHNSNIIREIKYQISDSLAWLCVPTTEQHPKISIIEIVNISPCAFNSKLDHKMKCDDGDVTVEEELEKIQCGSGKQEYSKMIDSDEEKNEEEEEMGTGSSNSEDDDAGYERHFMPTDLDIREIDEQERTEKL